MGKWVMNRQMELKAFCNRIATNKYRTIDRKTSAEPPLSAAIQTVPTLVLLTGPKWIFGQKQQIPICGNVFSHSTRGILCLP